jgi:hypothetical protein
MIVLRLQFGGGRADPAGASASPSWLSSIFSERRSEHRAAHLGDDLLELGIADRDLVALGDYGGLGRSVRRALRLWS